MSAAGRENAKCKTGNAKCKMIGVRRRIGTHAAHRVHQRVNEAFLIGVFAVPEEHFGGGLDTYVPQRRLRVKFPFVKGGYGFAAETPERREGALRLKKFTAGCSGKRCKKPAVCAPCPGNR